MSCQRSLAGALGDFAQRRLEFCEGLLDRVQIWAAGRRLAVEKAILYITHEVVARADIVPYTMASLFSVVPPTSIGVDVY
jgi:hypothetical protein